VIRLPSPAPSVSPSIDGWMQNPDNTWLLLGIAIAVFIALLAATGRRQGK
jgi:hypothetical protein